MTTGARTIVAAVLIAGAALAAISSRSSPGDRDGRELHGILVDAVGADRRLDGRLSGGFRHGRLRSDTRAASPEPPNLSLLAGAGRLQQLVESDPSAVNLWSFGVAQLLLGRADAAIRDLTDAVSLAGSHARLHSDLAAAHIARAGDEDAQDLARALDAAERALALDATLLEARFNKAIALERAGLTEEAAAGWREYVERDGGSAWAQEAQSRLAALESRLKQAVGCLELSAAAPERLVEAATRCPQQAREHAERELAAWANAMLAGDARRAAAAVAAVERIAAAHAGASGDRMLVDALAAIRRPGGAQGASVRGHHDLDRARSLYDQDRREEAATAFRAARAQLRRDGNPFWLAAQHSLATIHTHRRELDAAAALLNEIERHARRRSYLAVQARATWLQGFAALQRADPSAALELHRRAAGIFERIGETGNLSSVMNAAADNQRILGDLTRGWVSLSTALRHVGDVGDPTRRYLLYYNAALFAEREGLRYAALHYQRRASAIARSRPGPVAIIEASINTAAILGRLDRIEEAEVALGESERMLSLLRDVQPRAYQQARIAATRGEFLLGRDPTRALPHLDSALAHFDTVEPAEMPRLLLLKGMALERAGAAPRALATYVDGITRFEDRLRRVRSDEGRVSYSDEGWELYRTLMALKLAHGDLEEALTLSDRARGGATRGPGSPVTIEDLRRQLRPDQVLVHYTLLERAVHAWVIDAGGVRHQRLAVDPRVVEQRASHIVRAVAGSGSHALLDAALRALHEEVIAPLDLGTGTEELLVIPDGALRNVPFAALRAGDGRYLAERMAVVMAGSAAELAGTIDPGWRSPARGRDLDVLAVGNPDVDRGRWPELAPLPYAGREAARVAAMYRQSTALVRAEATRARLLERLPTVDVFHFAGHAVANHDFPERSVLLVTPSNEDSGELETGDLRETRLKRGAIVVLSACDTAAGPWRNAVGPQSLARAFLSLGAGAVIAARWAVEDVDTSELMTAFHERLSAGQQPSVALRRAQVSLIQAGKPVRSWAAFAVFARQLR